MSWDAGLVCDSCGHQLREWNYTHNTNPMIEAALGDQIDKTKPPWWVALGKTSMGRGAWWELLDGTTGGDSIEMLDLIIERLATDPDRFRAMNPENGWGDYDSLLGVLREMRAAVPAAPCHWEMSG